MSIDITLLCCPDCGGQSSLKLNQNNHNLHCTTCNNEYAYNNGVPIFLDTTTINANQVSGQQTAISSIKQALHKITRPRHHSIYFDTLESSLQNGIELDKFIQDFSNKSNVLNVGSLAKQLTKKDVNIINLDISHYNNIDVVADAHRIPIKDGSLDGIIIKNVFEHIREPIVVRDELFRTLKKGGRIYAKVPFMQPFHAVPNDFQRYTINGLKEFFKDFKVLKHGIAIGPSSTISSVSYTHLTLPTKA